MITILRKIFSLAISPVALLSTILILMPMMLDAGFKGRKQTTPVSKAPVLSQEERNLQAALLASFKAAQDQSKKTTPKSTSSNTRYAVSSQPVSTVIYETVPQQQGADCGYHALYNAWRKYQQLHGYSVSPFPLEQWRSVIMQRRTTQIAQGLQSAEDYWPNGAWLHDGEIEFLAARHARLAKMPYTIIPSVTDFNEAYQDLSLVKKDLLREGAEHYFILGSMRQTSDRTGTLGHWIAVVVRREQNRLCYYVIDSRNGRPQHLVDALKKILGDKTSWSTALVSKSSQPLRTSSSRLTPRALTKQKSIPQPFSQRIYQYVRSGITHLKNVAGRTTKAIGQLASVRSATNFVAKIARSVGWRS